MRTFFTGFKGNWPPAHMQRAEVAINTVANPRPHPAASAGLTALRVIGAVVGGYALTAALVALLAVALAFAGMARSEAVVLSSMLGFVFYLVILLWAFSVRSLPRLFAVLLGGTGLAYGLLQLAQ